MSALSILRRTYRSIVPAKIRDPIGWRRRLLADEIRRVFASPKLPPAELLERIQLTPFLDEYLRVGALSAAVIEPLLDEVDRDAPVLDFGCGAGRIARHIAPNRALHGCDVDADAVAWCAASLPGSFSVNGTAPPLAYDDASFAGAYSVSVFTHLDATHQSLWASELGRVLRPGAPLIISTLGPNTLDNYPALGTASNRARLAQEGFLYVHGDAGFSSQTAIHTADSLRRFFGEWFEIARHDEHGLDGFQDLVVMRRRSAR